MDLTTKHTKIHKSARTGMKLRGKRKKKWLVVKIRWKSGKGASGRGAQRTALPLA